MQLRQLWTGCGKMAQWTEAHWPDDVNLVLEFHKVAGENQLLRMVL